MSNYSSLVLERAERVAALVLANPGISGRTLAQTAGLSRPQMYQAVACIRDQGPDEPLISHPIRGYRFTTDEGEVTTYRNWRISAVYTIVSRLWTGVVSPFLRRTAPQQHAQMEVIFLGFMNELDGLTQRQPVS